MLKLPAARIDGYDATPTRMVVTVPRTLAEFIKEHAQRLGISPADLAGQLVEDAFLQFAEEPMMELRVDPKALSPAELREAYLGVYDPVTLPELAAMAGLPLPFLCYMRDQGHIPGRRSYALPPLNDSFDRDEAVPWVFSVACEQHYAAHPQFHPSTP